MKKKLRFLFCALARLAALFAGGCGGSDEEPPEDEPAEDELREDGQEAEPGEDMQATLKALSSLTEVLRQSAGEADGPKEPLWRPAVGTAPSLEPAAPAEPAAPVEPEEEPPAQAGPAGEAVREEDVEEEKLAISLAETVNYVEQLDPALLGLEGEDMGEYEVLPNQFIVPVDGLLCSELLVYSRNGKTGTNELVEKLLVSRGPERQLYRLDDDTHQAVLLTPNQDLASDALASQTQDDPSAKAGEESG